MKIYILILLSIMPNLFGAASSDAEQFSSRAIYAISFHKGLLTFFSRAEEKKGIYHEQVQTGEKICRLREYVGESHPALLIAPSSDGNIVAATTNHTTDQAGLPDSDKTCGVRIYDASTGRLKDTLRLCNYPIRLLALNNTATLLATKVYFDKVRLTDLTTNTLKTIIDCSLEIPAPTAAFLRIAFSPTSMIFNPSGSIIALLSEHPPHLYDTQTGMLKYVLKSDDTSRICTLTFCPKSSLCATGSEKGTISLWHTIGELPDTFQGHTKEISSLAFKPNDSTILASGSHDGTVRLWNILEKKLLCIFCCRQKPVESILFSPNGKQLLAKTDQNVFLFNLMQKA